MKDIAELLDRFIDGETSVEEETALADFFRNATDADKPADMLDEDWKAYREMFRQFDEGFDGANTERESANNRRHLWLCASAAAAIAAIVMVFMLNIGGEQTSHAVAEAESPDTAKAIAAPIDTLHDGGAVTSPSLFQRAKPKKRRRLPYTPPVPRNLIAKAAAANGISEESMAVTLEETERLINAMAVYQELRINEICSVEYQEEY